MKITLKNTQTLYYLSIVNIVICGIMFCELFTNDSGLLVLLLTLLLSLSALGILIYLVRILLFFKESTAVFAAFSMLAVIIVIDIVTIVFPHLLNGNYLIWLSTLTLVIDLLAAFRSFFVKAAPVKYPFMVLGSGFALLTLPRLFALTVASSIDAALITITGDIGAFVVLFASCFILKRLLNFLKAGGEPAGVEEEI